MSDDSYLAEEAGRRRTARRLLDLLAAHVPRGRLLEIGCGHGLLLDEARRRGYDTSGLELSAEAARHAREVLGLEVRETPLEDLAPDHESYDAIVLIDVLEHLSDPVDALERSCALLAPGGALMIATPDPSSLVARAAGRRWWSYIPAHNCLIPRATLRELISARGLVLAEDVPYVASFTLRYWLAGLSERGGWAAGTIAALAARLPPTVQLTASLRDEHVLVARRIEHRAPARARARDRKTGTRVYVVLSARNASSMELLQTGHDSADAFDRVLLVHDGNADRVATASPESSTDVLIHPVRCGGGASQKTGCTHAMLDGADIVVVISDDSICDPAVVRSLAEPISQGKVDVVIGRPHPHEHRTARRLMTWATNRVLNLSFTYCHAGNRAFSADFLRRVAFLRNSDDLAFDREILMQIAASRARVLEVPLRQDCFEHNSPASFAARAFQTYKMLAMLTRFRVTRNRRRWLALRRPAAVLVPLSQVD